MIILLSGISVTLVSRFLWRRYSVKNSSGFWRDSGVQLNTLYTGYNRYSYMHQHVLKYFISIQNQKYITSLWAQCLFTKKIWKMCKRFTFKILKVFFRINLSLHTIWWSVRSFIYCMTILLVYYLYFLAFLTCQSVYLFGVSSIMQLFQKLCCSGTVPIISHICTSLPCAANDSQRPSIRMQEKDFESPRWCKWWSSGLWSMQVMLETWVRLVCSGRPSFT